MRSSPSWPIRPSGFVVRGDRRHLWARTAILAAALCACGEEPDAGWIEIGTGTRGFEPLRDGAIVPIEAGLQGGHHITGALRVFGPGDAPLPVEFILTLDGEQIGGVEAHLPLDEGPGDARELLRVPIFLWDAQAPERLAGRRLTLSARVDWSGQVLRDRVAVEAAW